jgi:hypothetical protein
MIAAASGRVAASRPACSSAPFSWVLCGCGGAPGGARLGNPSPDFGYCPVRGPHVASGLSRIRLSPVQKAEDAFYRRSRQPHRGLKCTDPSALTHTAFGSTSAVSRSTAAQHGSDLANASANSQTASLYLADTPHSLRRHPSRPSTLPSRLRRLLRFRAGATAGRPEITKAPGPWRERDAQKANAGAP